MPQVAVIVGSLRAESQNVVLAKALQKLAGARLDFRFIEIGDLPLYNEDVAQTLPAAVQRLKRDVEGADAVLFVTPEYNRSIPAALKNAIDWGSRPYGQNSWAGKPASIVGTTPGAIGTAVAQSHLRSILPFLDVVVMGQPEVYFQSKPGLIDANFEVTDDTTRAFLEGYLGKFVAWIDRFSDASRPAAAAE